MGRRTAKKKRDPYISTSEERPQKSKRPPAAVSISLGITRSLLEAAGRGQELSIMKRGGQTERLVEIGGIDVVGSALLAVEGRCSLTPLYALPHWGAVYSGDGGGKKGNLENPRREDKG